MPGAPPPAVESVVDACLFHNWLTVGELLQYLPGETRDYFGVGQRAASGVLPPASILPRVVYPNPLGASRPEAYPPGGGQPGSDVEATIADHLEPSRVARAVLCHDLALPLPAIPDSRLSVELTRACNDWTLDRWVSTDERLYASIMLPSQVPEQAAAEIRRLAGEPRVVAATLCANGLGRPFGHEIYGPIFAAAAECGLPITIVAGGDESIDTLTHPTAGGLPASFTDLYALRSQSLMTHMVSLIVQGVFESFPTLKVMLLGGGVGWLIPQLWHLESLFPSFRRDTPWLRKRPTDYVLGHIRVGTHPLDRTDTPERLADYLGAQDGLEDVICYASGYPSWDSDRLQDVEQWLPAAWLPKVVEANAEAFFRWPTPKERGGNRCIEVPSSISTSTTTGTPPRS